MFNIISIKEMYIKSTVRYNCVSTKLAKVKTISSVDENVEQLGLSHYWQKGRMI